VAPSADVTSLLNPVPALAARLQLMQGDLDVAVSWVEDRGLGSGDTPAFASEPEQLVLARVLIVRRRPDEAVRFLDRLADAAATRTGSLIEIDVLRALALADCGRPDAASAALRRALELGWDRGWRRVFLDEGEPIAALLARLAATRAVHGSDRSRQQAVALLAMFGPTDAPAPEPSGRASVSGRLIEPLSDREIEVLRLVAVGHPNREIANALFVTLDTVKKHVTHILGKLEVTNRTEAAARARALGLLDEI
jgi:LuxR family maltose regulon positive regulatory protein